MKHSIKYSLLLVATLFSFKSFSQEVPKGFELLEIVKISETYRLSSDISFDMSFTYADSAQPNSIMEQLQGSYKIHNGKYWGIIDSIEYLQGSLYNLAVFHKDSIISVSNRQEYSTVLQVPMMDSLFREANVSAMNVTKVNDSTRMLRVLFNPNSQYRSYEIQYDRNSFLIRNIKYYLPGMDDSDPPTGSGVICVAIHFSNYSQQPISEEYFNEARFVFRQGDEILARPLFDGFRVMVSR